MLCLQISSKLTTPQAGLAHDYHELLYRTIPGYHKGQHYWEPPLWAALVAGAFSQATWFVVTNVQADLKRLRATYDTAILASALDSSKEILWELVTNTPEKMWHIGGDGDLSCFEKKANVTVHHSMPKFLGIQETIPDYRFFRTEAMIPRLVLSTGCQNNCAFCIVERTLKEKSWNQVMQQVRAIATMKPTLVYVNDKTFGQALNHTYLTGAWTYLKALHDGFDGFIIQSTAPAIMKISPRIMSRVHFCELGIESFNDDILKAMRKPHNTKQIEQAMEFLHTQNIPIIPNIMIGLPGETPETYNKTLTFLDKWKDAISHLNIYHYTDYTKGGDENTPAPGLSTFTWRLFHQWALRHLKGG